MKLFRFLILLLVCLPYFYGHQNSPVIIYTDTDSFRSVSGIPNLCVLVKIKKVGSKELVYGWAESGLGRSLYGCGLGVGGEGFVRHPSD